jgi:hypothetical protein
MAEQQANVERTRRYRDKTDKNYSDWLTKMQEGVMNVWVVFTEGWKLMNGGLWSLYQIDKKNKDGIIITV